MPGLDPFSGRTAVRSGGPLSLSLRLDTARFAVSVYRRVKGERLPLCWSAEKVSVWPWRRFGCLSLRPPLEERPVAQVK